MNAKRRIPMVLVLVSLALMLLVPTGSRAQTEPARLSDVTVSPQPDSVTVFVKTSREAQYKADLVDSPSRLVIDLEDTVYAWRKTPLTVGKDPVRQVRGGQYRKGVARIVLDLTRAVGYAIREESDGLAIVIPTAAPAAAPLAPRPETRGLRKAEKAGVLRIVSLEQLAKEREATARVEEARIKAESEVRIKAAEAQLKEQEAIDKKRNSDAAAAELLARGPLREETIRLSYGDPEEIAKTLQGILGIPAEGIQAQIAPAGGPPPIAGPPFSALYGTAPQPPPLPPLSPAADVLAKGITIRAHKPTNSIFIRHYEHDLERIKKLIREKLDVPLPQVKIEARMEILDRNDLFAIGVQWGGGGVLQADGRSIVVGRGFTSDPNNALGLSGGVPVANVFGPPNVPTGFSGLLPVSGLTGLPLGGNLINFPILSSLAGLGKTTEAGSGGGIAFGLTSGRYNVNLALEALRVQGKTRTLARPEIVTVENGTASISLGEEIPYATVSSAGTQVQFKEAALRLDVVPTVIREGDINKIKMKVIVENNARGVVTGGVPAIDKRRAQTEVLVKEGDRLVIGGGTKNTEQEQTRKVPLFGDIPVLGWLFKTSSTNSEGKELVIFITPSVLRTETAQAPTQKK